MVWCIYFFIQFKILSKCPWDFLFEIWITYDFLKIPYLVIFQILLFLTSSLILLESENILCMILILLNLLRFVLWLRIRSFWMFHLPLKRTYNLLLLGGLFHKRQLSQLFRSSILLLLQYFYMLLCFLFFICCNIFMLFYIIAVMLCSPDLLYYWYSVYLTYWLL